MFRGEPHYTPEEFKNAFLSQKEKGLRYTVMLSEKSVRGDGWQNVHAWCKNNTTNYSWNGSYFHFETTDIAVRFRLLWG